MAIYPSGIYTGRTMANRPGVAYDAAKTKVIFAEDFNLDRAEITAIETELGTLPKGSAASVGARIQAVEDSIPASGGGNTTYKFRAYRSSNVTIATDVVTTIVFDTENFDPGSDYDNTTGGYTVPVTGYYLIVASVGYNPSVADKYVYVGIFVDDVGKAYNYIHTSSVSAMIAPVPLIFYLTAGQVVNAKTRHNFGVNATLLGLNDRTFFSAHLLSI